jgi:eukaryotic-like serine/threonine-protein kinase
VPELDPTQQVELRELGRFEVGVRVGGGGMADVYVGRGPDKDGRDELVAIKVIREALGNSPKYQRMFSDEAKLLALLSHPNLIRTIEYGVANDRPYIVMELLAGRSLLQVWRALVASGEALPIHLGAWICARIADGLHAAHELSDSAGASLAVIHRDVNPSNIFLTHAGEVKLIDFGLAKARARLTSTGKGMVKGKAAYIAPESLARIGIDRRVDVFALGTTLWELGTMQRLFRRKTEFDTVEAIVACNVPDPRSIRTGYPNDLCAVVLRALKKDRDERYPTAAAMRDDLDAIVASASTLSASAISAAMSSELAALVTRLFPGEGERHASWRHEATLTKVLLSLIPPPIPGRGAGSVDARTIDDSADVIEGS